MDVIREKGSSVFIAVSLRVLNSDASRILT